MIWKKSWAQKTGMRIQTVKQNDKKTSVVVLSKKTAVGNVR